MDNTIAIEGTPTHILVQLQCKRQGRGHPSMQGNMREQERDKVPWCRQRLGWISGFENKNCVGGSCQRSHGAPVNCLFECLTGSGEMATSFRLPSAQAVARTVPTVLHYQETSHSHKSHG